MSASCPPTPYSTTVAPIVPLQRERVPPSYPRSHRSHCCVAAVTVVTVVPVDAGTGPAVPGPVSTADGVSHTCTGDTGDTGDTDREGPRGHWERARPGWGQLLSLHLWE